MSLNKGRIIMICRKERFIYFLITHYEIDLKRRGLKECMKIILHTLRMRFISLMLITSLGIMMAVPTMGMATQPIVNLGITSTFAVLAGSTITNTGTTTISGNTGGDIGLSSGTSFIHGEFMNPFYTFCSIE